MKHAILIMAMPLAGCMGTPVVNSIPTSCSSLIPPEWSQGVEGVDPPGANGEATNVGDWEVAFDGQTGRLDTANGRTRDAIGIVSRCEERDAAAIKRAQRNWLQRIFGQQLPTSFRPQGKERRAAQAATGALTRAI